jgi:hypothetical protein
MAALNSVNVPPPLYDAANQLATDLPAPPGGLPNLASPNGGPPDLGQLPEQARNLDYLKQLWTAVQSQDINMNDSLLKLPQQPTA